MPGNYSFRSEHESLSLAGLVPAISLRLAQPHHPCRDCRDKKGVYARLRGLCPAITVSDLNMSRFRWPGLSRPSRSGWHSPTILAEIAGTKRAFTPVFAGYARQ